jgi:hypothetical protein
MTSMITMDGVGKQGMEDEDEDDKRQNTKQR